MVDAKGACRETLRAARSGLVDLSHRIHSHPEIGFEEENAAAWLAAALAAAHFRVEAGVADLPTAFVARAGTGPLHIAICAEYDALPGIGHACGHNMIAAMAVGAAMALSRVADDVGLSVSVIGTPAEENGGGKILLLRRGAFHGVHAAMMVHPAPLDAVEPAMLAWSQFDAHFTGRASHASVFPELGINAADALVVTQTAIGLLRQHVPQTCRIHGIVTAAGEAPNVIPANASARYIVRAETAAELEDIKAKVIRCFEAGALATGASLDVRPVGPDYAELTHNGAIAARYRLNAEALGRVFPDLGPLRARAAGSTDMGNVSKMIPTIHPTIGIGSLPAINHQAEFAAQCVTQVADDAIVDGALAMAWTAIDIALDRTLCSALLAGGGPAATRS